MKKRTRVISCILALMLTLSLLTTAGATALPMDSTLLERCYANIIAGAAGEVRVVCTVEGRVELMDIGVQTILLKEKAPTASTWTTVKNYSYLVDDELMGHNVKMYDTEVVYAGISGYSYQATVICWGANATGSVSSRQLITDIVVAQ